MMLDQFNLEIKGLLALMVRDGINADWLAGLQEQVDRIAAILEEYRGHITRINAMEDFSVIGKQHRIAQLGVETAGKIRQLGDIAEKYEQHIMQLERQAQKAPALTTDAQVIRQALRDTEIRTHYWHVDPLLRKTDYDVWAAAGGSDELMLALESSPVPILDPETITQGQEARAARLSPEFASQIRQLRALQAAVRSAVQTAISALDLPKDDPLLAIAAGESH